MIPDIELEYCAHTSDVYRFFDWLHEQVRTHTPVAVDTETTGLDWSEPHFVRLVQFGTPTGGWAVPMHQWPVVAYDALDTLKAHDVPVIMHNAKFDMHALASAGLPVPSVIHDTMILHHLAASHERHGLKDICRRAFGPWAVAGQDALKREMRRNGWDWGTVPVDLPEYWAYGVLDTCLTAQLFQSLPAGGEAYEREMRYQRIMFRAERRGMRIDVDYAEALRSDWADEIDLLRKELSRHGIENPNSNRLVEAALVDLGWMPSERTPTGQAKLDGPVLRRLVEFGGPEGHIAETLIRYKRLVKWTAAYLDPFCVSGGRVHPSINTMAARTGRSSITNPPLQTLPHTPDIRRAVIPDDGCSLYAIDYAGQEARIFASYAGEDAMIREFVEGGGDMHALVASLVYGPEFTPQQRTIAKTVNFAMLYGAGPTKIAQSAGVHVNEIKRFLATYDRAFPKVARFMREVQESVVERAAEGQGYVHTRGGRRVVVDADKPYTGVNYLIQGSGADVLKEAVVRLDNAGLADYIVVPVHDELVFQFPQAEAEPLAAEAADIMTNRDWFAVPLTTDTKGPLSSWGQAYE